MIAIAYGAAVGVGLGDCARAALMIRGYAEMQRMALPLGARPETLVGLSGFDDLTLTCSTKALGITALGSLWGRGPTLTQPSPLRGNHRTCCLAAGWRYGHRHANYCGGCGTFGR